MPAKWKKNFKPDRILEKIDSIKKVDSDKKVSYTGFDYHDAMAALQSMVEFPDVAKDLHKELIISRAINIIASNKKLESVSVINQINNIIDEHLSVKERTFHVLTTISMGSPYPSKIIRVNNCAIKILDGEYPNKFKSRYNFKFNVRNKDDVTPSGYAKVIVSIKAKSDRAAASTALRELDIQRALWCLLSNSSMEWSFGSGSRKPINKIRLGAVHTVHKGNGDFASESYWYEPNYVNASIFHHPKPNIFKNNLSIIKRNISLIPYKDVIDEAMLHCVRALDEADKNIALIRLWTAIETITSHRAQNSEPSIKRISFLFKDRDYHEQILTHLRDYRNRNLHAGEYSENAKTFCYQLQFYFHRLVLFHINNAGEFFNLDDANAFLDLPSNKKELENRIKLFEKAIKFITPKE